MTDHRQHLALVPRDGFFAKDGRGWHTSSSGRGHSLDWPWPSTVLGALRSLWGRGEEARSGVTFSSDDWRRRTAAIQLGRTIVLRREHSGAWTDTDVVWPVPLDALWLEGAEEVHRLDPIPPRAPTLGRNDDEARERLWRPDLADPRKPLAPPRWWRSEDFFDWLAARPVRVHQGRLELVRRTQVRLALRPEELTVDDNSLFSHDVVETLERRHEWALGVEVAMPNGELSSIATLGSDSRVAWVEQLPGSLFAAPARLLEAFREPCRGLRLVAVSPLCFARGWLPDHLDSVDGTYRGVIAGIDVVLRAAFVPRPMHVSGWDMAARQAKPASRMVPPGAVYFLERADGRPFGKADAESLWLTALGSRTAEGFGRVVPGVWSPRSPQR